MGQKLPTEESEPKNKEGRQYSRYALLKKRAYKNQASATFKKFKDMSVAQYLILSGKVTGKSDEEIAKQLDCHVTTVQKHKKDLQKSEWMQDVVLKVLDMADLWVESLRVNLLHGNPIVTIAYGKGLGVFVDKHEVTQKIDRQKQKEKFVEQVEGTLGIDLEKDIVKEKD